MLDTLQVADYMIGNQLVFRPDTNVLDAIHQLLQQQLSGAPVVDAEGQLVGFLSEKDCLRVAYSASYFDGHGGPVGDHMAREVRTLTADASLIDAIDEFLKHPHRCFPVVDEDRLVGQISRRDILRAIEKVSR